MNHLTPMFRRRFRTFQQLEDFFEQHEYDPRLALRYLVAQDLGVRLRAALCRPLEAGGLGERSVSHGSWVLPMGIAEGDEWTAGLPEIPGISSAHLAARSMRDVDMFFPEAVGLDLAEHVDRGIAGVRSVVTHDDNPDQTAGIGLGGLILYVPNHGYRYPNGSPLPDWAWNDDWPGQVWSELLAVPLDPAGDPMPEKAIGMSLDIHPPGKIPLPIGTTLPARSGVPMRVPGFRQPRVELVPRPQLLVNKALLLTTSGEYFSDKQRVKGIFDAFT